MIRRDSVNAVKDRLVTWSEWHALTVIFGALLVANFALLRFFAILALASFTVLILYCRPFWTSKQIFGAANCLTGLRLAGLLILMNLPNLRPEVLIGISMTILLMDGLDGFIARKLNLTSEFGEYFDKEVDALFMLALCMLLNVSGKFGYWILFPGLLRYLFVLLLHFAKPPVPKEYQSSFSKWIFFVVMVILIFDFIAAPSRFASSLTLVAALLLGYSFSVSLWRFYRK